LAAAVAVATTPVAEPMRVRRNGTKLRVTVPSAGTIRLTGAGVRTVSRRARAAGALTLKVQTARRTARIRLVFRPVKGDVQERRLTIRMKTKPWGRGAR
jgi:hypothetical protein